MDKNSIWKWLILAMLVMFSLWAVYPPDQKIKRGIDIQGGTSFTVEIDKERMLSDIRLQSDVVIPSDDSDLAILNNEDDGGIGATTRELKLLNEKIKDAPERIIDVLRNRIDSIGINEPVIYPGQDGRIIIQLPGIGEKKLKEAEASILSAAFLEFRLVHKRNMMLVQELFSKNKEPLGFKAVQSEKMYRKDIDFKLPMDRAFRNNLGTFAVPSDDYEFMLKEEEVRGVTLYRPCFVKRRPEMTGDHLKNAMVGSGALNQSQVNIEFDSEGATDFARVTEKYSPNGQMNMDSSIGRQLAIVLDGKLYSYPTINQAIFGGRAEITGSFTPQEARLLANILKSGSLPAPVRIVEKSYVSPSLGQESINNSIKAIVLGGICIVTFMLIYYLFAGVIANIALLLNMVLLPLGMIIAAGFLSLGLKDVAGRSAIQLPVLTLPGMAGILLTIGMAVDANVLIFERIREESRKGKSLWSTITDGYDKAFVTIMDANLTTLLTGMILFRFGSGPIRGFAVTLCAGIIVSMFTALVVTKLLFGVVASFTKNMGAIKMLSIVGKTAVDFVRMRKVAAILSIAVILLSSGIMLTKGLKNPTEVFAVDFMGGTSLTFDFKDDIDVCQEMCPVDGIRTALTDAGIKDPFVQYQEDIKKDGTGLLQIKTGNDLVDGEKAGPVAEKALKSVFADAGFVLANEYQVGSQVGKELKKDAIWSIVFALLGIIIYISIRFEFGFALGAIVALTHDVLITVGLYSLFGRQLSLPIVAALLTIVGYSVNDTIVVFDRIRETLVAQKKLSFVEICNLGINQTLSRTILTSFTTLITVVMLLLFGGGAINDFALALCIGVIVGTYSSIFIATPVVLLWHRNKKPEFAAAGK